MKFKFLFIFSFSALFLSFGFGISAQTDFNVDFSKPINIAVILAEPQDKSFDPVHNKQYYETQIIPQVKDYWCEVSFGKRNPDGSCSNGKVNLNFEVFDDNGKPFKLEKTEEWYGKDEIEKIPFNCSGNPLDTLYDRDRTPEFGWDAIKKVNEARPDINFNIYDTTVVIYAGHSESQVAILKPDRLGTQMHPVECSFNNSNEQVKNFITIAENEAVRSWTHELGHAVGRILTGKILCDLYDSAGFFRNCYRGSVGEWDVMGGSLLGGMLGTNPPHLSSFSKIELGWLGEDLINIGFHDTIESLETMKYGDKVKRYNLDDNSYYLLEARTNNPQYSKWDVNAPATALVVYKVALKEFLVKVGDELKPFMIDFVNPVIEMKTYPVPIFLDPINELKVTVYNWLAESSSFKMDVDLSRAQLPKYIGATFKQGLSLFERLLERPQVLEVIGSQAVKNRNIAELLAISARPLLTDRQIINFVEFNLMVGLALLSLLLLNRGRFKIIKIFLMILFGFLTFYSAFYFRFNFWMCLALIIFLLWNIRYQIKIKTVKILSLSFFIFLFLFLLVAHLFLGYRVGFTTALVLQDLKIKFGLEESRYHPGPLEVMSSEFSLDLDLHALTPDGKHTGMNYETGEYENQIPGALASGDLVYDDEWIFVPEGTIVKYYVSSRDIQQFFQKNPDLAQQLPSPQETYTLSAIYYDSQSQRYESQPLANLSINPGENIVHQITGTTDISISPGMVDNQGPIISHTELQNEYILNSQPITFNFSAQDEGVGLKEIAANLDNQPIQNGDLINFHQIGVHQITITATDFLGNTSTKIISFNVIYNFSGFLPPIKTDGTGIYKQGRTLPVKFQLQDADNQFVSDATAYLYLAKIQDNIIGAEEIALSTSQADTGNQFRYDPTNNQYIFNFSTASMSSGTWQLRVDLGNNTQRTALISIKE